MSSASITDRLPVYDEVNTSNDSVESIEVLKRRRGPVKVFIFYKILKLLVSLRLFLRKIDSNGIISRRLNL